ncbi:MAG: hypothetical protein ABFD62_12400 [Syntrophaceae bacterium]
MPVYFYFRTCRGTERRRPGDGNGKSGRSGREHLPPDGCFLPCSVADAGTITVLCPSSDQLDSPLEKWGMLR